MTLKSLLYFYFQKSKLFFRATIDIDNDGDISQEEFIQNALNSSFIADIMKDRESKPRKSDFFMG